MVDARETVANAGIVGSLCACKASEAEMSCSFLV